MTVKFIVILQSAWCNENGTGVCYNSDLEEFDTRKGAIKHGFELRDSDDFNIGVVINGCLSSFDWMNHKISETPETIQKISEELGLEGHDHG